MQNKGSALFLSITAWLSCILVVSHNLVFRAQYPDSEMSILSWINILDITCTYVVIGLLGFSIYNNNKNLRKNASLILTIASGIWLAMDLYHIASNTYWIQALSELRGWLDFMRFHVFSLITPLSLLLTGIAFNGTNISRQKKALVWLLLGGLTFVFTDLANLAMNFYLQTRENGVVYSMGDEFYASVRQILNLLAVPFSVAMVVFAISGYNSLDTKNGASEQEEMGQGDTLDKWEKIRTVNALSPIQWLGYFLLSAIPIAGYVFLVIWGSDHQNRVRRNWAIMQFWAATFGMGLNLLLLGVLLDLFEDLSGGFALLAGLFIVMIVISSILTYNYFQQPSTFEDDQNPTLGTWLGNFIIIAIPIIGIIMLIVWATDSSKELIKKWAIAQLIWIGISLMMWVYFYSVYGTIQNMLPFQYFQF
ncbi:MAG TPA: hypothetical protein VK151_10500 [Fluviicola sp.]|nr:hypothetical protein [Fluviicola sp.]